MSCGRKDRNIVARHSRMMKLDMGHSNDPYRNREKRDHRYYKSRAIHRKTGFLGNHKQARNTPSRICS
eukprot:scaffold10507_cov128-Cylindrotheca_fusiformis.AAC.11